MLASCAVRMRDAQLAIRVMDHLVTESPNDPRLLSAVARLHLQLGSIRQAELQFMRIEQLVPSDDKLARMNRALYAVASGKYEAARELFNSVAGDAIEDRVCAANNACVCDVYLGHPQRMLDALQKLMVAAPRAAGASEELVFNYCTGLDLQYDGQKLREEKARKMVDVAMWAGDGFNTASFKLQ
ncbi:hypothetical protein IW144_005513 [Coemansia sp. RSA 522]|nr:hypothetical protein IW144_005513 [Coemansia sp. RSA 522]